MLRAITNSMWSFLISIPYPWWIIVIAVGAALFAVGNLFLPLSKQAKETRTAVRTIEQTLKPEILKNLEVLQDLKQNLTVADEVEPPVRSDGFRTGAWSAISKGELILKLRPEIRTPLVEAYSDIFLANEYHHKLLESMTGISTAMSNAHETRLQFRKIILSGLKDIEPRLRLPATENFQNNDNKNC